MSNCPHMSVDCNGGIIHIQRWDKYYAMCRCMVQNTDEEMDSGGWFEIITKDEYEIMIIIKE
jgi:hypothetical protein